MRSWVCKCMQMCAASAAARSQAVRKGGGRGAALLAPSAPKDVRLGSGGILPAPAVSPGDQDSPSWGTWGPLPIPKDLYPPPHPTLVRAEGGLPLRMRAPLLHPGRSRAQGGVWQSHPRPARENPLPTARKERGGRPVFFYPFMATRPPASHPLPRKSFQESNHSHTCCLSYFSLWFGEKTIPEGFVVGC